MADDEGEAQPRRRRLRTRNRPVDDTPSAGDFIVDTDYNQLLQTNDEDDHNPSGSVNHSSPHHADCSAESSEPHGGGDDSSPEDAHETDRLVGDTQATEQNAANQEEPGKERGRGRSFFRRGRRKMLVPPDDSGKNSGRGFTATEDEPEAAGDEGDIIDPAMDENRPEAPDIEGSSICSCLYSNLMCRLAYRLSRIKRDLSLKERHPEINLGVDCRGLSIGITVHSMISIGEQLVSIVKPMVKIHAVNIDTGYYIKSKKIPVAAAVCTKPCTLKDSTSQLEWNEEMILDAYFADVASENTLLLFELLDDKPSLSSIVKKRSKQAKTTLIAKRIAWAYLLPVGHGGELNIGFSDDWKAENRYTAEDMDRFQNNEASDSHVVSESNSLTNETQAQGANAEGPVNHNATTASEATADGPSEARDTSTEENSAEREKTTRFVEGSDNKNKSQKQRRQIYPWDKPSPDKRVRLQLYYYRQYDGLFGFMQRKLMGWPALATYSDNGESCYPNGIPEVYVQWRLQRHIKILGTYLCMSSGPRPVEVMPYALSRSNVINPDLQSSSQRSQKLDNVQTAQFLKKHGRRGHVWGANPPKSQREQARLRSAVMKRTRGPRERCVIPDKLVYRLDPGGDGAMVVSFSTSGHILAVAAKTTTDSLPISTEDVCYSLRLFDTDLNEEVWVEDAAHHAVIYDIKWTRNDRYLLTVSGDGTCKVWDMISLAPRCSNMVGFGVNNSIMSNNNFGGVMQQDESLTNDVKKDIPNLSPQLQALISKPPQLVYVLSTAPPVYTYSGIFTDILNANAGGPTSAAEAAEMSPAEHLALIENAEVPRIITGAADGRIRIWEKGQFINYIYVSPKNPSPNDPPPDYSPHEGAVNSIVIDERSRYLITGDSAGDILAWRQDPQGSYQLLRKFKRDAPVNPSNGPSVDDFGATGHVLSTGGVQTLQIHPEKHRGQMLALLRQPPQLKMINMSTYKTQCICEGFGGLGSGRGAGVFFRAALSSDGRYVISGTCVKGEIGKYCLQLWDSQTGHVVRSTLSDYIFPYPVRSISWHPAQHMLAVAMVGTGAAVVVYSGDRESMTYGAEESGLHTKGILGDDLTPRNSIDKFNAKVQSPLHQTAASTSPMTAKNGIATTADTSGEVEKDKTADRALKSERAKMMLEKIKASREKKKQEEST